MQQRIGNLNGRWAWAFKVGTVLLPFIASFCVWIVSQQIVLNNRLTRIESIIPVEGFPPMETRERLVRIETRIETVYQILDKKLEKNSDRLVEILTAVKKGSE